MDAVHSGDDRMIALQCADEQFVTNTAAFLRRVSTVIREVDDAQDAQVTRPILLHDGNVYRIVHIDAIADSSTALVRCALRPEEYPSPDAATALRALVLAHTLGAQTAEVTWPLAEELVRLVLGIGPEA